MKRSVIAAALAAGLVLAGCDNGGTEPAPPPTSEEALSTATAPPTPTPSDEVEVTTEAEAAPTTQAPEADGPPEMPKEALEQTEAGAEAFALHYIDLINYTGKHPETGLLEPLGGEDCQSCRNYEGNVSDLVDNDHRNDGPAADILGASAVDLGGSTLAFIDLSQNHYEVLDSEGDVVKVYEEIRGVQFKFELEKADPWLVTEIQVSQGR